MNLVPIARMIKAGKAATSDRDSGKWAKLSNRRRRDDHFPQYPCGRRIGRDLDRESVGQHARPEVVWTGFRA